MKCIAKPHIKAADLLDACIDGIAEDALKARFTAAKPRLLSQFTAYESSATSNTLFSFSPSEFGKSSQIVIAGLSKKELMELYSNQMVEGGKPARKYYDRILMLAHFGKCPYCGFGQASTLDHFLPKARYPAFSVLSCNLVPSCTDCNRGKGSPTLSHATQVLHPYFEEVSVEKTPWLFSRVVESVPATVEYFVKTPCDWPEPLKQRIINHFTDFKLARRFSVEAASEIVGISHRLEELKTLEVRAEHLSSNAKVERKIRPNSWQAALYDALATNTWYQQAGFRNESLSSERNAA